jgi:hypothetical protein
MQLTVSFTLDLPEGGDINTVEALVIESSRRALHYAQYWSHLAGGLVPEKQEADQNRTVNPVLIDETVVCPSEEGTLLLTDTRLYYSFTSRRHVKIMATAAKMSE